MLRFVQVLCVALAINAGVRAGNAWWQFYEFKDAVRQEAMFAESRTPHQVHERVMQLAEDYEIPVGPDDVIVGTDDGGTVIDVVYEKQVELVPRVYTWTRVFDASSPRP
ncbi:MAG: hypothetical protein AB7H88_17330 [Vicinamibacterales bacterium]